ncbi:MAG: hypothetical protein ACOY0T_20800 [Myxococcota bacterium]
MASEPSKPTRAEGGLYKLVLFTPLAALALAGVTAFVVFQARNVPRARVEVQGDEQETPLSQPVEARSRPVTRSPKRPATAAVPAARPPAAGEGPLDPEGQALYEQMVEEDQQTLQPEDLEVDPTPPPIDYRTIKAYRDQNIDADGNLN